MSAGSRPPYRVTITWQAYQPYGDRILQRFPQAQADLVERLAKANLDRFRNIQEEKRENLIKQQQQLDEAASRISGSIKYRDSALGTSLATGSIYAETLMAYGQSEDLAVRVPPLPEGAKSGAPFECLACGRSVSIKNNSAWKKHLWRDLRPWICHDSACDFGNEPFASLEDWVQHLEFDHDFQPSWSSFECPLCHEETGEGKTVIVNHLARHMEEISLAALPSGYDSDNDLEESGDENEDEDEGGDEDEDDNCESLGGPFGPRGRMADFIANPMMNPPGYGGNGGFDIRGNAYSMRHHDIPPEPMISAEDAKLINTVRDYKYYPGPIDETQGDRVDLFNPRPERDGVVPHMTTGLDVQWEGSNGSQILDPLLADAPSTHDPTDERPITFKDHGLPDITISHSAGYHDLYTNTAPHADGLYHCPWEGQPNCNHQPLKLKANYE
ncbi:hypothetical protein CEP54_009665 [Fusarium duplospermum]|uniref:Oxidoreductase acuF-like C2H2 type zinc-finger domain-containing protein n=1 Tax=Fusarium duplospermum TaxID=1325734 RepID=A0A428PP20_9HYPO|nr:hypothetical protein CEP54_009665 [Fusarium duplospermum]